MLSIKAILVKTAWWAPATVLLLHQLVRTIGLRDQSDGLIHFSGGLAITLFIWTLCPILVPYLGQLTLPWRFLITFAGGCSAALIWELAEFASDKMLFTHIQHSINETMMDLVNGFSGCCLVCVGIAIRRLIKIVPVTV